MHFQKRMKISGFHRQTVVFWSFSMIKTSEKIPQFNFSSQNLRIGSNFSNDMEK